jgi:transposase
LRRIAALYEIEARVRGKSAADRLVVRQIESRPLITELRVWFEAQLAKLPARGPTAEAIRYALNHWDGLQRFLEDGRIELDNNSVERAMRPVALSRKNSLFAGSDEGGENWACLASLIETCKLNGVNPQAYFTDLLTRLVNGWPRKRIDDTLLQGSPDRAVSGRLGWGQALDRGGLPCRSSRMLIAGTTFQPSSTG